MKLFGLIGLTFLAVTLHIAPVSANKDMPKDNVHTGVVPEKKQVVPPKRGEISKPKGGKTIAELFSEKDKLNNAKVLARAKVMKVNKSIMGKNWVTLADGTGQSPDDRIVATSQEIPSVGDVVTVQGVLKSNVEVGAGYQYKALIEDAKFSK
jgi:hypothetical protein